MPYTRKAKYLIQYLCDICVRVHYAQALSAPVLLKEYDDDQMCINDGRFDGKILMERDMETITIAVCGTHSPKSLLNNMTLSLSPISPFDEPKVHTGFLNSCKILTPHIRKFLFGGRTPCRRLFITGHSSGGGMAIIFAYLLHADIKGMDLDLFRIAVFGTPPIGNVAFRRAYQKLDFHHTDIRITGDIIPYIGRPFVIHVHKPKQSLFLSHGGLLSVFNHSLWHYRDALNILYVTTEHDSKKKKNETKEVSRPRPRLNVIPKGACHASRDQYCKRDK